MHPRIGRRSLYNKIEKKPKSATVEFVERNTKKNITMKQEYLVLEDVKIAMNIHHLETSINFKKWLLIEIQKHPNYSKFAEMINEAIDKDRHRLQKDYKITLKK
jgi:hypothetical protein